MLRKHLKTLFAKIQDNLVEQLFLGSDREIQVFLEILDNKAKAVCAALAYQWIARQLLRGTLAPPTGPVFGHDLDVVEKWRIVKKYNKFSTSVKDYAQRVTALQHQGYTGQALNTRVLEQPYEAMIGKHQALLLKIVAKGAFPPWDSKTSDQNVERMVRGIEAAVLASYNAERELKQEMATPLVTSEGSFSERDLWPRGFKHYMNQDPDFYAILSVKSITFGHSMGIRFQKSDSSIHFYDPNAGHYRFASWQNFLDVLQLYWMVLWMDESETGNVYPPGLQFVRWYLVQYRKKPLDPHLEMFLFDDSGVTG